MDDFHLAFVAQEEMVKARAKRRGPRSNYECNVEDASPPDSVEAVTSAWTGRQCNQYLEQESSPGDKREHAAQVRAAGGVEQV